MSKDPRPRVITIELDTEGGCGFSVLSARSSVRHLTWDEMLGQIAALTMPPHLKPGEPLFRPWIAGLLPAKTETAERMEATP